jgi:hypothetical protein
LVLLASKLHSKRGSLINYDLWERMSSLHKFPGLSIDFPFPRK